MKISEIISESQLDEVNMSPSALAGFASTDAAQSMMIGFEAEFLVKNLETSGAIHKLKNKIMPGGEKIIKVSQLVNSWSEFSGYQARVTNLHNPLINHGFFKNRKPGIFDFEPDSTIDTDDDTNPLHREWGGIELISPPMPLAEGLAALDKFYAWASTNKFATNTSTGFHVGVSLPGHNMESFDPLKVIVLLGDQHVLDTFDRGKNEWSAPISKILNRVVKNKPVELANQLRSNMKAVAAKLFSRVLDRTDKGISVNFRKNYIEFRSAGGDYLNKQEDIKNTVLRYVQVLAAASNPEAYKQEYAKKLYKIISAKFPQKDSTIDAFVQYSAGLIGPEQLKTNVKNLTTSSQNNGKN